MESKESRPWIATYAQISLGVALLALGIELFLAPHNLVFGGATGLGIISRAIGRDQFGIDIPLWLTNLVINIPLFIWAWRVKGFSFLQRTGYATAFLSLCLYLAGFLPAIDLEGQLPLAAIFGGMLGGVGFGIAFRCRASTGGSDLAAMLIQHYKKHLPLARILLVIDASVIALGLFVFGPVEALYAIIGVYVSSIAIGRVLEGLSFAKAAFIITDMPDKITAALLSRLTHRGGTLFDAKGMYTGMHKNMLLCVVSSKEIVQVKEAVAATDKNAFVIVADVREVVGKGFVPRQN